VLACRTAVRGGVVGRPAPDVSGSSVVAAGGLQPCLGGVLLVVDVLRRGRFGGALWHRLSADLSRPAADADVRLAHHRAAGLDRAQRERGLDRRLHLLTLWPLKATGGVGRADRLDRRDPVSGAAVQGGGDEPAGIDRRCRRREHVLHRSGAVCGAADGLVRDPVRHPPGRCHRTPPRHDAGDRAGVDDQAGGDHRGGSVRLSVVERPRGSGGAFGARAVRRHAAGGFRRPDPA